LGKPKDAEVPNAAPQKMQWLQTTCPSLMSVLEALPLYGSPVSLAWPFTGLSIGAAANLVFKAACSPEQQLQFKRSFMRVGGPAALAVAGVYSLIHMEVVPETGRLRCTAKWPWLHEEAIADLEPIFENFLDTKVMLNTDGKPRWATSVFSKLKMGNPDLPLMAQKDWKIKVIDESLAMLLCFVVPRSRSIWMSSYYIRLVEDEAQLAYVLGHELSHVICQHGKDFCFLETVREAGLLATGAALGWIMIDGPRPATAWGWVNRFARFFALAGASCFALAVFFNVCFVLPMRRQLELEADFCGLKYAAKACFQLHSIPGHWDTLNFVGAVPEWRSTHPNALMRKSLLLNLLPWANIVREKSGCKT